MNREIKFRAWNPHVNKIFDPTPIFGFELFRINKIDLMQYTGLKDKNGVEIYEGDIVIMNGIKHNVKHDMSEARKYVNGAISDIIEREPGRYVFEVKWNAVFGAWQFVPQDKNVIAESDVAKREIEVIGNIYENPELLHNTHP